MVKYNDIELNLTFNALADPTRRAIISELAKNDSTVVELAKPFDMSLPGVSKHLKVLEKAGLLEREINGRVHKCTFNPKPLKDALLWVETYRDFWESKFDSLAKFLEKNSSLSSKNDKNNSPKKDK